jgi:hypothetical protein
VLVMVKALAPGVVFSTDIENDVRLFDDLGDASPSELKFVAVKSTQQSPCQNVVGMEFS